MGLLSKLEEHRNKKEYERYMRMNEWEGCYPGDVVEYKGEQLIYLGINPNGCPGAYGVPEPMFFTTHPHKKEVKYIRELMLGMKKVGHITPNEWYESVNE